MHIPSCVHRVEQHDTVFAPNCLPRPFEPHRTRLASRGKAMHAAEESGHVCYIITYVCKLATCMYMLLVEVRPLLYGSGLYGFHIISTIFTQPVHRDAMVTGLALDSAPCCDSRLVWLEERPCLD